MWQAAWGCLGPFLDPEGVKVFVALHRPSRDAASAGGQWTFTHILWRWQNVVLPSKVLSVRLPAWPEHGGATRASAKWPNLKMATWYLMVEAQEDDELPRFVSPNFELACRTVKLVWHPFGHPLSRKDSCALYLECDKAPALSWRASFRLRVNQHERLFVHHFSDECPRWGDADFAEVQDGPVELGVELLEDDLGPFQVQEHGTQAIVDMTSHARLQRWAQPGDGLLSEEARFGRLLWSPCGMRYDPDEPWWDVDPAFYLMLWCEESPRPTRMRVWRDGSLALEARIPAATNPGIGLERWTGAICWDPPTQETAELFVELDTG
mmetsp:Transcript_21991/g.48613  ORF Transcript_21991/g.48613 Transcript_21991/m.48613 type:complete len:323 (-) Transcript_21991:88-1056(-)